MRESDGIMRGIINVLHTTGKNLSYHPHIHSLVSVEGLTGDDKWQKKYLATTDLEATYRQLVKTKLSIGLNAGLLKPPTTKEECINLIEKLAEREWRIFQSEIYLDGEGVFKISQLKRELEEVEGTQTEVYTRIVGYYRSVKNWNGGKKSCNRFLKIISMIL